MPIARLTYRLPEEEPEFRDAREGAAAKSLLWEIDQRCRSVIKHEMEPHSERVKLAEEIRQCIREAAGVTLE